MSDEETRDDNLIEGHNYDGIQELDHPLPRWWVYLFYVTIVYAVIYFSYYEFFGGPSHQEQYQAAMTRIEKNSQAQPAKKVDIKQVAITDLLNDPEALKMGEATFKQYCAACHGQKGEGVIGPNLTDKYWIHSKGDSKGIMSAILKGFPTKGMPPWGEIVPVEAQPKLAAYVISLGGTNPPNAKAAQGELIE